MGAFNSSKQTFVAEAIQLSRFEQLAAEHGIPEDRWDASNILRAFARQHRERYYVPSALLIAWGFENDGAKRKPINPETWLAQYRKQQSQFIHR